ncbi:MAG: FAD:protein FMN transferase [Planctomycetes bacterium]|nr:FAD:protein FMN transferase [Planctomycetota bacterium]
MKQLIVVILLMLSGLIFGWLSVSYQQPEIVKRTRFLMNTHCTIQAQGEPEKIEPIIDRAFARMEEIDRKFNAFNPTSPVYRFNHHNEPITDPEIVDLIKTAQEVNRGSDGAFDITVKPLVRLWGFYNDDTPRIPSPEKLKQTMNIIGHDHLIIKDRRVAKDQPGVRIDFGGIAKGYALKETMAVLENQGVSSALIKLGGQVHALGKINGQPWKVGVKQPRGSGVLVGLFIDQDISVATSGDYEKFLAQDGRRYHHILNPKTGYPTEGVMSTSVITPDPVMADAWSTAFFVLGVEKSLKLVQEKPEMELIIITDQKKIIFSPGVTKYIK